jgi:hypothetical protein
MPSTNSVSIVELTDAEIDAVAGGANPGNAGAAAGAVGGLVAAGVAVAAKVGDVASDNNVAVSVLSGPTVIRS